MMEVFKRLATLRSLTLASMLSHSDNKQVSVFVPSALHPNAFAKFITTQSFLNERRE